MFALFGNFKRLAVWQAFSCRIIRKILIQVTYNENYSYFNIGINIGYNYIMVRKIRRCTEKAGGVGGVCFAVVWWSVACDGGASG